MGIRARQVVVGIIAKSRAANVGAVIPAATTQDAARARTRARRIGHRRRWITAIPIFTPLPDIAVHIVKPPSVWRIRSYRRSLFTITAFRGRSIRIRMCAIAVRLVTI